MRVLEKISLSQVSADADLWYPDRGPATPDSPGCRADPQTIIQDGVEVMVFKPEGCVQEKASRYRVLHVIGDSHTLAYAALYKQFAIRNNLEVDVYRNGGCPFISFQSERDIDNLQCREQAEKLATRNTSTNPARRRAFPRLIAPASL